MREMVLNHASLIAPDRHTLLARLLKMTGGMVLLNKRGVTSPALRMSRYMHEIPCADGVNLREAIFELQREGARDEFRYLIKLSAKVPLLDTTSKSDKDRFLRCEVTGLGTKRLSPDDAAPMLYSAVTDGISVGFPSHPVWEHDRVDVYFNELLPDDELREVRETIDNLTRPEHADAISERSRSESREIANPDELWDGRDTAFPNLIFGPDVKHNLNDVEIGDLSAIFKKLSMIDECAANWQATNSAMPDWGGKVTPESRSVRNNRSLIQARRFKSHNGTTEIFEWHARFGRGRIHLRFDARRKDVEIGYIGKHLPL